MLPPDLDSLTVMQSIIPILAGISSLFSALGAGKSNNRADQNNYQQDTGRTLASIFGTQQNAQNSQFSTEQQARLQALLAQSGEGRDNAQTDLSRRQFALNAPTTRAGQAVRGSMLQSLQPATLNGGSARLRAATPTISGGFSAANLGPGAREAGKLLESGALAGLKTGDTFDALPKTDFQGGVMKPPPMMQAPAMPGYKQPGMAESIFGLLGSLGPLLQAFPRKNRSEPTFP